MSKKRKQQSIHYADLASRKGTPNVRLNDFTLFPPNYSQMTVCQSGHKSFCQPGWHTSLNTYDHYILHYILSGSGTYYAPSGTFHVAQGEFFLIRPNESIHYQADFETPWTYYWVGFNGISADSILELCGFSDDILVRSYGIDPEMENVMHELAYPNLRSLSREYALLGSLFHLFSLLISTHIRKPLQKSVQYLHTALEFIQQRYPYSDLRISDIASFVGIDRTYLYRIFYESFGMSIQDFILQLRLKKAQSFLKYSDTPLSAIAANCGFETQAYFSSVFKRHFHISPLQYRRQSQAPISS